MKLYFYLRSHPCTSETTALGRLPSRRRRREQVHGSEPEAGLPSTQGLGDTEWGGTRQTRSNVGVGAVPHVAHTAPAETTRVVPHPRLVAGRLPFRRSHGRTRPPEEGHVRHAPARMTGRDQRLGLFRGLETSVGVGGVDARRCELDEVLVQEPTRKETWPSPPFPSTSPHTGTTASWQWRARRRRPRQELHGLWRLLSFFVYDAWSSFSAKQKFQGLLLSDVVSAILAPECPGRPGARSLPRFS